MYTGPVWERDRLPAHCCNLRQICDVWYQLLQQGCPSIVRGYVTAVNTLFQLRDFKQPTNLSNPSNMPGIIINNLIKEENVASQRSHLDSTIFAELQRAASSSHSCDSD
jgi:hypothetical protein